MKYTISLVLTYLLLLFVYPESWGQGKTDLDTLRGIQWSYQSNGPIHGSPLVLDGVLYAGSNDKHLYALDIQSGDLLWKFKSAGAIKSTPAASPNLICFTADDGFLYALDKHKGQLIWKFDMQGEEKQDIWDYYLSSPVFDRGVIYIGSGMGGFYALNAEDGSLSWSFSAGGMIHSTPVVDEEKVYFGSYDGWFYGLNRSDGSLVWKFNTIGQRWFPKGAVQCGAALHENTLYFGSRDFNIYALNKETGTGMWNRYEQGSWVIATPLIKDTLLLFGTSDSHRFYALDRRSGKVIWETPLNLNVFGEAAAGNRLVYFGSLDGKLYALDLSNGNIQWTFQTQASKTNWNQVFDRNNHLRKDLFQNPDATAQKVYSTIHSLGSILSTPVLHEGKLYFGSMNGKIYCLH